MQTFLPYSNFILSAESLDDQRLLKQISEGTQIMKAMHFMYRKTLTPDKPGAWENHPATRMWWQHRPALFKYLTAMHNVWLDRRGHNRTHKSYQELCDLFPEYNIESPEMPSWLGREDIHRSHRSNLTRKLASFYKNQWQEPDDLDYIWPK